MQIIYICAYNFYIENEGHNTMKKLLITTLFFILTNSTFSQFYGSGNGIFDGRFGVTAGGTNFSTDTNFLFSKSSLGYSIGVVGTASFSSRFELLIEINYTRNFINFVGREDYTSEPEDIKFKLENFNVPFILNYNYLNLDDTWYFGIDAGISTSFLHNYKLVDESKANYYLEPLYAKPYDLEFDTRNEQISFNAFFIIGLSAEYNQIMCNLRYHKGITDPYRNAPIISPIMDITGKDNYFSISFTYFFEEKE